MTEVVVCDRDTKQPEILRLAGAEYEVIPADREGRAVSRVLGVRFRRVDGTPPRLRIEDADNPSVSIDI